MIYLEKEREFNIAPLSGGYMITSIVGFLISAFLVESTLAKYVSDTAARTWAFTLVLFFTMMFIASLISMTYAPTEWPLSPVKKK